MNKTKQTLLYFLKSLPVDCYFNIISFGYDSSELFSGCVLLYFYFFTNPSYFRDVCSAALARTLVCTHVAVLSSIQYARINGVCIVVAARNTTPRL